MCLNLERTSMGRCAVLDHLTAIASLFAGLLRPMAIALYAAALSGPAWIVQSCAKGGAKPATATIE